MSITIPLSVLLQGPAATAAYLAQQNEAPPPLDPEKLRKEVSAKMEAVLRAVGLDVDNLADGAMSRVNIAAAMGGIMMAAATVGYAAHEGNRAKARDFLGDLLDNSFDVIEEFEISEGRL